MDFHVIMSNTTTNNKLELLSLAVLLAAVALLQRDPMTATQAGHYEDQTTQFLIYILIPLGLLLPVRIFCNSQRKKKKP